EQCMHACQGRYRRSRSISDPCQALALKVSITVSFSQGLVISLRLAMTEMVLTK
uniref:Uncharacterized protein n=1 Tax=Aegilops tauschii subsp. strangulata TaxID=200361 RepID=A0A453B1J2_AEGTS